MKKIVVITGASNGMGEAATKLFAKRGWVVYGGARRVEKIPTGDNIHALKLDVTDSESNHVFINKILEEQHQIDVLINNAGYGEFGPIEEIPLQNAKKQFDTNFFGAVELTQLVLPIMRKQGRGRIVNISSVGGDLYTPLGAYYHATKAAIQQWSDVLDLEVSEFGIRSVVVQPGGTQSSWGDIAMQTAKKNLKSNSSYVDLVENVTEMLTNNNSVSRYPTADELAETFYKAATDERPKWRYFNSLRDRLVVRFVRSHPRILKTGFKMFMRRESNKK
ncbi:SDR family NAD(P)-dependent oxidoreductase [Lentilactobacillus sp. SPB1-3]|uniref:SDR family NAD(P)-dependent oxidoreductase n=1 Tax=Lentilactobacillus terminaliae TaxID=3003483 RepID=A0ACD5DGP5_9LACO|nr:SDR family NAD(P)-dependent oxidoreductase [Lentilactobacillus sp. SPB1-3]MCZ0977050.1 SDR family NAD(P)-dependent oxidoreductase [Lentilactobacillus sp. SPB1-3]